MDDGDIEYLLQSSWPDELRTAFYLYYYSEFPKILLLSFTLSILQVVLLWTGKNLNYRLYHNFL